VAPTLISTRDGIAGHWNGVPMTPVALPVDNTDYLKLLSPSVRETLFNFELVSRLGFSMDGGKAQLWHLETNDQTAGATPPTASYHPLMTMVRPTEAQFVDQTDIIANYVDLRRDRALEIEAQLFIPSAFFGSIAFLDPGRTPHTFEMIVQALELATFAAQRFKYALAVRRPIEYSAQIQPIIETPQHGALPSGHATEAHCFAMVMTRLLEAAGNVYATEQWRQQFFRLAARIAINRTVAGVHFPVDSVAGASMGMALGEYFVQRMKSEPDLGSNLEYKPWNFVGTSFSGDFIPEDMYSVTLDKQTPIAGTNSGAPVALNRDNQSPLLHELWKKAVAEWA